MIFEDGDLGLNAKQPIWPPARGLLSPDWMMTPRELWTAAHWRHYAEALETDGYLLVAQIEEALEALRVADASLKRSRKVQALASSLLDAFPQRKRSGRPVGSAAEVTAAKALVVQAELRLERGKRVTDQEALIELFRRDGKAQYRVAEHRAVINAMGKLRR